MDNKKYNWSELWAEPFVSGGGGGGGGRVTLSNIFSFTIYIHC